MNKKNQLIMVIKREILFGNGYFEGFKPHDELDYETEILKNYQYMKRGLAESNPNFKQPIAYSIVANPSLKKVFVFRRSSDKEKYYEDRLHGNWSWGVGGHIEKSDTREGNPIYHSLLRELSEEIEIEPSSPPKALGYINYDEAVHAVHFGVLYVVETNQKVIKPADLEIENGKLRSLEEIEEICTSSDYEVEEWSRISLNPLKQYLQGS